MNIADAKIKPATGVFFSAPVVGIIPVFFVDFPDIALPRWFFDIGSPPAIVSCEVVVVPNRVDGNGFCEFAPLWLALTTIVVKALHLRGLGVVDVNIVAKKEKGAWLDSSYGVPHSFVFGDISRSTAKADGELVAWGVLFEGSVWKDAVPGPSLCIVLPGVFFAFDNVLKKLGVVWVNFGSRCFLEIFCSLFFLSG